MKIKLEYKFMIKKYVISVLVTCVWLTFIESVNAQSLYKSIGPNGKVIYSNHPPAGAHIEKKLEFDDLPSSQVHPQSESTDSVDLPTDDVVLYAAAWCGYCRKAKAYLASKGINYKEIDIDTGYGSKAFARVGNGQGIPLLFASGQRVQGYSLEAYDEIFSH